MLSDKINSVKVVCTRNPDGKMIPREKKIASEEKAAFNLGAPLSISLGLSPHSLPPFLPFINTCFIPRYH